MMTVFNWISFPQLGDSRGSLVALEGSESIPFDIKRVYYIIRTELDAVRGLHAHKRLKQFAVCVAGRCRIILDNGRVREEAWLDSPTKGIVINEMLWREMHDFSDDCVLLVLASEHYDEADYIRDYDEFLKMVE